jgi:diaminopimelate decarboxylase
MIEERDGALVLGGISCRELVERFGEPLYAFDGETAVGQVRRARAALPPGVRVLYSMKANPNMSLVALLGEVVDGIEVSSLGELHAGRAAGIAPARMIFVGPAKSELELREALAAGVGCVVVESEQELDRLGAIAGDARRAAPVALRINPELEVAGPKLRMGGAARQFGIDEDQAPAVLRKALRTPYLEVKGLHAYVGTRILDCGAVVRNTSAILGLARRLHEVTGAGFEFVDVGGGWGIPYYPGEAPFDLEQLRTDIAGPVDAFRRAMPQTKVVFELGRFLVADAGVYLTRVRYLKRSRQDTFALVGGGMNHFFATSAAGSFMKQHFPIEAVDRVGAPATDQVSICGPLCTPSDVLASKVGLPPLAPGDLIGVRRAGAYGLTASPADFLSHARPAEVLVWQGHAHLVRRAPDASDVLRDQILVRLTDPSLQPDTWAEASGVGS